MTPEQLIHLDTNARWANRSLASSIDPNQLPDMVSRMLGKPVASATVAPTAPVASPASPLVQNHAPEAVIASASSNIPMSAQGQSDSNIGIPPGLTAPATGQTPVPIPAPPLKTKPINAATFNAAMKLAGLNRRDPVTTQADALQAGTVAHGTHILADAKSTAGGTSQKEQDTYWREGVRGLQSIRGDQQVKDIETQRNAAINGYNRLSQIEAEGKAPNPVDYVDIVGQIYKARTGQAPSEEILKQAVQETGAGKWGQAMTFLTGKQQPATTKDIASSLKDMVAHMGFQADDLHDGVMQAHGSQVLNPNMSPENVAKLAKIARGKSFVEATGAKPEDFDPHLQAIKWAQANPNDPRSAAIMQKAMQAKQGAGGQSGL